MSTTQQIPLKLENVILKGCRSANIHYGWMSLGQRSITEVTAHLHEVAAEIEKAYILIPRAELPKTEIRVESDGRKYVSIAEADSLWPITSNVELQRRYASEYLAAAEAITAHQAAEKSAAAEDAKKLDQESSALRDALLAPPVAGHMDWLQLSADQRESYRRAARKARELHKAPQ